jgi:tRNA (cmo5U34)-methyltransferase
MQDTIVPKSAWQFDEDVALVFDDMLQRSIPQYDVMRATVYELGCHFVQTGTHIVDLGCSRGAALAPFIERYDTDCSYIGIDTSAPMIEAARERFVNAPGVSIRNADLRTSYPDARASVTLCVLTLQFVPIEYRQRILRDVYRHTMPGGALLFVEKVMGETADIDDVMVRDYYTMKARNGYSQEQIERKRLSLEGVLVPVTARWNEAMLRSAGFQQVDCFWRWMNFAGWLAIKD